MHNLGRVVGGCQDAQLTADRLRRDRVISGDHDRLDARGPGESDGRDGLGARGIGDADESQQSEARLSGTLPHRDGQDAEALPRQARVGFHGVLRAFRADGEDDLDGSLHVQLAVATADGHALGVGIERLDRHPRMLALDSLAIDTALGGGHEDGQLRRIARPASSVRGELRVGAGGGREEEGVVISSPQLTDDHDTGGEGTGLVGADDRGAAEGLH